MSLETLLSTLPLTKMTRLWLDRETYGELDLSDVGAYKYADTAQDLMIAWAIDDDMPQLWDVTQEPELPKDLEYAMIHADEVWAHNAQFDRAIHNGPNQQWLPRIELRRWRCSMAMALSHALPASLDELCSVLDVPESMAKMKEGSKLVQLFTKPLPANRKLRRATRETHPEEWRRFGIYAQMDIVSMREVCNRVPKWNWRPENIEEWHVDQEINDYGFFVDRQLTRAGIRASINEKERIAKRFAELVPGGLRPTQREKFKEYLNDTYQLHLDNTRADTFNQLLKRPEHLDPVCAEILKLSIASNKTSTAKYAALDPAVQDDGRFRGALQFSGASRTRRWAGRIFQAQNLPARGLPPSEQVQSFIECLIDGTHTVFFDDIMRLGSAALRGVLIAPPGKKLVVADLSNIEGRMLAWLAGERWKLKAFRAYDAGTGPDLYNITAVSIIGGDPWKVAKENRNVFGKVPDLASGYQGGVKGYQKFAKNYGVRMADHWETMQRMIDPQHVAKARENLEKWGRPQLVELEISETEWLASETCKLAWRERHPATRNLWYNLQDAAKSAINEFGQEFTVGDFLRIRCVKYKGFKWMLIRLPSGNLLTYHEPHIMNDGTLAYYGDATEGDSTKRVWTRVFTHGGKLTGNCCQTTSRDILAPALGRAKDRGYMPVLSVHDEGVTETPDTSEYSSKVLVDILSEQPEWAPGLPLAAAGFEAYRYKKD